MWGVNTTQKMLKEKGVILGLDQIRGILKYLSLPTKISESEFITVFNFCENKTPSEIREEIYRANSLKKWGTLHPNQSKEKRDSAKKNWKNNPEKGKQTCLERYGVESFSCTKEFKDHQKEWLNSLTEEEKNSIHTKATQTRKANGKEIDHKAIWESKIEEEKLSLEKDLLSTSDVCELLGGRDRSTVLGWLKKNSIPVLKGRYSFYISKQDAKRVSEAYKLHKPGISESEKEVLDFVKSLYKGVILENDKTFLDGKELDIYIPEKRLAIEFNGCYWHSDKAMQDLKSIPPKEVASYAKYRHLEKTKACEEKGVRLIHVFEDDWELKRSIVEDIIKIALDVKVSNIIFARKCELKPLGVSDYRDFLEANHLQGYSAANIRLGLFFKGQLIECIGFSTKGTHSQNTEMVRLCTKIDTVVIGGFSKLLKHSGVKEFVSYIDRSTFSGKGYFKNNFSIIKENKPVYFYVNLNKGFHFREPRYLYMRKNIKKLFQQGKLKYWNPEETEEVNMYKNGYARIWNCGTIKVLYKEDS